ncbi:MAG: acyl-homoserine-lactone acylase [Rhizobiales bacterium]|nr:acyl-homoserine-lactone acylase [Hyphomicrobiales bacterium]MBA68686.1 acyl-homoserine-lactone acylase [Hyphomicrobiales bacterium]
MRRIIKALFRFLLVIIPLIVIAVGAGMLWLSRSLAPLDGDMTIDGLSGPVTITRDEHGVPHIKAATRADAAAGLGFVHAQERLWQMQVNRMAGQGRLSEMFGEPTIGTDRWLRTMGIAQAAEASLSAMDEPTMAMLEGYARGVNAWMDREPQSFSSKLPPEFVVLGVEPDPWTPVDTLTTIKMMSVTLSANVDDEADRLAFARLGFTGEEIDDLLPPLDVDNPPPLPDLGSLLGLEVGPLDQASLSTGGADGQMALFDSVTAERASNNWVVSGDKTESGKPIVANDPHLALMAPSIWYLAHLEVTDEFDTPKNLIGASLPGAPFVFLGRNDKIAWGFTNTGTDAQDIFVERVNPDNPDEYLTPSGWQEFEAASETIHVKGSEDVIFTRRSTRHGPVLPGSYKNLDTYLPANTVAALKWVALATDDTTANAGAPLFRAETVSDFQALMHGFLTPMQSMVVADVDGNIGFISPGRVPVRDPANQVMGRAPVPGWNAVYDWRGYVPYGQLPRQSNPEKGAIGTANTKIVGPDYPHFLTFDWEEPYRQNRVDQLIVDNQDKQTPETSRLAQADVQSEALATLRDRFIEAVQPLDKPVEIDGFLTRLGKWDAEMSAGRAEPLVMMAWARQFMIEAYSDDLGPSFDNWFKIRGRAIEHLVTGQTARNWCDRAGTDTEEQCPEVLLDSLEKGIADLKSRYGDDANSWDWAKIHVAHGAHRPFSQVGALARFFDVDVAHQGGPFTLDRGQTTVNDNAHPYVNTHGASFRGIYDLGDLDASTFIHTTGQSGNVFSRHYRDFADTWARVEGITIPAGPVSESRGVWTLEPGEEEGTESAAE